MTKVLIKVDGTGRIYVYADCPNVEVVVNDQANIVFYESDIAFKDGVTVEDFEATQYLVW